MKESFEEQIARYRQEMMRYLPAAAPVAQPAPQPMPPMIEQPSMPPVLILPPEAPEPSQAEESPAPEANPDIPPPAVETPPQTDTTPPPCEEGHTDSGKMQAKLFTAQQAVPLPEGSVTISCKNASGEILHWFLDTNIDGQTATVALPAPDRLLSSVPGSVRPYSLYDIRADHEGYVSVLIENAQVFAGVTSGLPVEMVPTEKPARKDNILPAQHRLLEGG